MHINVLILFSQTSLCILKCMFFFFLDSLSGSDLENKNLDDAVERAYKHGD